MEIVAGRHSGYHRWKSLNLPSRQELYRIGRTFFGPNGALATWRVQIEALKAELPRQNRHEAQILHKLYDLEEWVGNFGPDCSANVNPLPWQIDILGQWKALFSNFSQVKAILEFQ